MTRGERPVLASLLDQASIDGIPADRQMLARITADGIVVETFYIQANRHNQLRPGSPSSMYWDVDGMEG